MKRYFLDERKKQLWDVIGNPPKDLASQWTELTHLEWELIRVLSVYDIDSVRIAVARFEHLFPHKEAHP